MEPVGDCHGNAMCKSFFATLNCELLDRRHFRSQEESRRVVFESIVGWYNPQRRHSYIKDAFPASNEMVHAHVKVESPKPPTAHWIGATSLDWEPRFVPLVPSSSLIDRPSPVFAHRNVRCGMPLAQGRHTPVLIIRPVRLKRRRFTWAFCCYLSCSAMARPASCSAFALARRTSPWNTRPCRLSMSTFPRYDSLGFLRFPLPVQPAVRISPGLLRSVAAPLSLEIHCRILSVVIRLLRSNLVLDPAGLQAGPGFQVRSVHAEVLIASHAAFADDPPDLLREQPGQVLSQQRFTIPRRHRRVADRYTGQTDKPGIGHVE